jgi:DNA-directed RNA polymerase subunit RPC12/RpoP
MVLKSGTIKSKHLKKHETPTEGLFKCLYSKCNLTFIESTLKKHSGAAHLIKKRTVLWQRLFWHLTATDTFPTERPDQLNCGYSNCKSHFSNSTDLRKHTAEHNHMRQTQYLCSVCGQSFSSFEKVNHSTCIPLCKANKLFLNQSKTTPRNLYLTKLTCRRKHIPSNATAESARTVFHPRLISSSTWKITN